MNALDETLDGDGATDLYQEMEALIKENRWAWQSVCAVLGLAGGIIAPLIGATADVITWFTSSEAVITRLSVLSIVFCALTLPLLILGAFFLGLLSRKADHLPTTSEALKNDHES